MQLIKELEPTPRSVYTGCIGCLSPGRKAAFNVAIRTITVDKTEGSAEYGVGGGIVWDSDAKTEYEECQVKASILTAQQPEFELLETILWNPDDGYHLLERHMNRLESSAKYFDYPIDLHRIKTDLVTAGEAMPTVPQKVRLLLDKHGAIRIEVTPLPVSQRSGPFRIALSSQPIDSQDRFLYHKTTNRAIYGQARKEKPDCDDVLLWNKRGEITESTIANVVVEKDGQLVTPPVECGLLPGVFRAHLLSCGEIKEQVITEEDVRSTSKFFIINSVRQWIPAQLA
jgi:para-aminobenzoate synthetase/4-amino-4-deoxychorismate lyase